MHARYFVIASLFVVGLSAPTRGVVSAGTEFQINTYTTFYQSGPAVCADARGNFVVAWSSGTQDGSYAGVFAQRFASNGAPAGNEFQVNAFTTGYQSSPAVSCDRDGDFVVAWTSGGGFFGGSQDGSYAGVFAQRFASNGAPAGNEFQVNTFTTGYQSFPAVSSDQDGDFVVAWASGNPFGGSQDGSYAGVFAQRFASNGAPAGNEFQVNTFTTYDQSSPAVSSDQNGDFVVAWSSGYQDGEYAGVFAQRFASNGAPAGNEFQVNTFTTGYQSSSAVSSDQDGDFVVAWASGNPFGGSQDGSYAGVFAQRFASNGAPAGNEFQVNTFTTYDQLSPAVSSDQNGGFVVAWASDGQDASLDGVFAQQFAADGVPVGAEFQVATYTTNSQGAPAVAYSGRGSFVLVWQSNTQDGDSTGVFGRQYGVSLEPTPALSWGGLAAALLVLGLIAALRLRAKKEPW